MKTEKYHLGLIAHYEENWGPNYTQKAWKDSAILELNPQFTVLEFAPTEEKEMWSYATCGMSQPNDRKPIEVHIFSKKRDRNLFELLSDVALQQRRQNTIDVRNTINLGRPVQKNSFCTHALVSLPYPDGAKMEVAKIGGKETYFYWLLPITEKEADFKISCGLYDLEMLFDDPPLNYLDTKRKSVV